MSAFLQQNWRILVFAAAMTFWSCLGQTFLLGLFNESLRDAFNLSYSALGTYYSIATLSSALLILWSGRLVDTLRLKSLAYVCLIGLITGALVLIYGHNAITLTLAFVLLRHFGQGLLFLAGTTAAVRYVTDHKGKASAIAVNGFTLSEAVQPLFILYLIDHFDWRTAWIVLLISITVIMPLIVHFTIGKARLQQDSTETQAPTQDNHQRQWHYTEVRKDLAFYLILPLVMISPMLFTGFIFHQTFIIESKSISNQTWGTLFLYYALTVFICKLIMGVMIDRFGAVNLVTFLGLPMLFGLLALGYIDGLSGSLTFLILIAITVGCQGTLSAPFFAETYGTRYIGTIKSYVTAAMVFSSGLTPILIGWLIDINISLRAICLIAVAYILCCTLLGTIAVTLINKRRH